MFDPCCDIDYDRKGIYIVDGQEFEACSSREAYEMYISQFFPPDINKSFAKKKRDYLELMHEEDQEIFSEEDVRDMTKY